MSETPEMVERVARALAGKHYAYRFAKPVDDPCVQANVDGNWHTFADEARAAIEAMREPNEAMTRPSDDYTDRLHNTTLWQLMITAALATSTA